MHRILASALRAAIVTLLLPFAPAFTADDLPLPAESAVAELPIASRLSEKPPYERLLQGEDAKQAEKLQAEIAAAEKADDYITAIRASEELLVLRQRVQGRDHWEAIYEAGEMGTIRTIAALSVEKRAAWRLGVAGSEKARTLEANGQYAAALPLRQAFLKQCEEVLGEMHPETASGYNDVAENLVKQGKAAEAQPLHRKALDIRRKAQGEEHPHTAINYNNLAINLYALGKAAEAQPLFDRALDISRKFLGEEHRNTLTNYNNMAMNLNAQGKTAEAQLLLQKALDMRRKVLGEEHEHTASSYSNVAMNFAALGKTSEALSLSQKALDIYREVLGEEHPSTALSYNNVSVNLFAQGKVAEVQPLLQKSLDICCKVLGEEHPQTASSYYNLARNLDAQGKAIEAHAHLQKSLDIFRKVLGEEHPSTATTHSRVAFNLDAQGKAGEALPEYLKVLEIRRKILGETHFDTVASYNDIAFALLAQGKAVDAQRTLAQAIPSYEAGRLAGAHGVDRATLANFNPRLLMSSLRAASDPLVAWEHRELTLARGLLDQQAGQTAAQLAPVELADQGRFRTEIADMQRQILALVSRKERSPEENRQLDAALARARQASSQLAELAVRVSQREVASSADIQEALPADAAIVLWIDVSDTLARVQEHWGCVVRPTGDPHWERLPGSGVQNAWTKADTELLGKFRGALAGQVASAEEVAVLERSLFDQRLAPLMPHLAGVTTLYVIGVDLMAGVPMEVIAPRFTVSYIPSGTFLARATSRIAPVGDSFLALGDPVFGEPAKPGAVVGLPPSGLLIVQVVPGGVADGARLKAGDVIVRYADVELTSFEKLLDLIAANASKKSVPVTIWREGGEETFLREVPPGKLGAVLSKDPAREAISNRRKTDAMLLSLRGGDWRELPGTRVEMAQIANLFGPERTTAMFDSDASEQSLDAMRKNGDLLKYRYLHFATHGEGNNVRAFESALILSQDKLSEDLLPRAGEPFLNGQLSAREVLDYWKLDAELVTLSACETAVGKSGGGDGMLGFAQAFLTAGARAVCLSLWKVDDTATSLLMTRFYQNLLGKRAGLDEPMGKAAALHEAKQWLRELSSEEALKLTASATNGVVRGTRGKGEALKLVLPKPADNTTADAGPESKPFAHPRFWSAFILIGDPN